MRHRFGGLIFRGAYCRNFTVAILMYKVKNNMCPTYISTLFEQPAIKYKLRNHDFAIPLIPTQTKLQLYEAAVLPYLTNCHLIWHFCRASDSRRLERIQERALRAIYCDKPVSYTHLTLPTNREV